MDPLDTLQNVRDVHVMKPCPIIRPESIMLENLHKMLLGISQKFSLLCLHSFLLCSIMLTVITAMSYVYTHN